MSRPYPRYRDSGVEWLGEVPEHWDVKQLGLIGSFFKGSGGTKDDEVDGGVPCVRYGDIYTQHQYFVRETRAGISQESATRYTPIRYGDALFAASGETLEEIGKSAVNLIDGSAYCGGDVIVFRPSVETDATFLGYAADCSTSIYQKACMGRGVTVMHIYTQELRRLLLPLPPLDEQRAIAAYLDRETARIDALVAKKRSLLERLAEYRTALITRTVTRGLDPSVAMKDSGVEWLGEVPAHWEVKRLGMALADTVGGGTPDTGREEFWADPEEDGLPWVAIADMSGGGSVDATGKRVTPSGLIDARLRPLPRGTIIYSMYASVGAVAHLGMTAVTNQAILGLVASNGLEHAFLYWWLTAIRHPVLALTRDNTQSNLNAETVRALPIVLPPPREQQVIAAYLDRETARADDLSSQVETAIERLQEYRTALITAAVTGKIDVRESALRETAAGGGGAP